MDACFYGSFIFTAVWVSRDEYFHYSVWHGVCFYLLAIINNADLNTYARV